MTTTVVGGGVVGLTTAYYLAKAGLDVVLVEQAKDIAPETSRTNAGLIAPGHSFAWASPAAPRLMLRSLAGRESAIGLRLPPSPDMMIWGARFLAQCSPARARRNSLVKLRLARYSQLELERLIDVENIECSYRRGGVLFLYRSPKEYEEGKAKMSLMRRHGQEMRELSSTEIREHEPALASPQMPFVGGLLGLTDTTADSLAFCRALLRRCRNLGVDVRMGVRTTKVITEGGRARGIRTDRGDVRADHVVLAAGAYTPEIDIPGVRKLPIQPARGLAIDVPVRDEGRAPALGGLDERRLVAWSRAGASVRLAAVAQFAGFDDQVPASVTTTLLETGKELFGDALHWQRSETRVGFRPMTPDGPPIIGQSGRIRGLHYNTGHGHMGWTMACGSAAVLRDQMLGRRPGIDTTGMHVRSRHW